MKRELTRHLAEQALANGAAFAVALIAAAADRPARHYASWASALASLEPGPVGPDAQPPAATNPDHTAVQF